MKRAHSKLRQIARAALGIVAAAAIVLAAFGPVINVPVAEAAYCYQYPGSDLTDAWGRGSFASGFLPIQIDNNGDGWKENYIQAYAIAPTNIHMTSFELKYTVNTGGLDIYTEGFIYGFTGSGWYAGSKVISEDGGIRHHTGSTTYDYVVSSPPGTTFRTIGVDIVAAQDSSTPANNHYDMPVGTLTLDLVQVCTDANIFGTQTPTLTPTANATQTAAAGQTQTEAANQTATAAAQSPTPTDTLSPAQKTNQAATQTAAAATGTAFTGPSGNLIRNWDFNVPPLLANSEWAIVNHVVQAPLSLADPINVSHLPTGSCGPKYWDMDAPVAGIGPAGSIFQDFQWPGGSMYVNFEAVTDSYLTYGQAKITNKDTGGQYTFPLFSNGTNSWISFKYIAPAQAPGHYSLTFSEQGLVRPNALVVDNVNVRTRYWGNDCPPADYHGQIPPNGTLNATATPIATATYAPGAAGSNVIQNCDFEYGVDNWTANPAVALQTIGGATGPAFAQLFTLVIPIFPVPQTIPGDIYQTFNWPGGPMYTSFFLKDGSATVINIKNVSTGFKLQVFTSAPATTDAGWTKYSAIYQPDGPGQYTIEFQVPPGSSAGLDGVGIAAGEYATGGCATASGNDANATQAAINQTATAAASPTSGAATGTANAQETDAANQYATYVAGFYGTVTAIAGTAQTQAQAETQTQAVAWTQTEGARETATAQGTAVATATATPPPPPTSTPTFPPPATVIVPPATLTAMAGNANATNTAIWAAVQTQQAAALQTQQAAGSATAHAATTQTAQANANATNQAIVNATAFARQTATAARATQAQATYNAGATQTALAVGGNATAIAAATQTQAFRQTQTQAARLTANAVGTANAAATQTALVATGDAAQVQTATRAAGMTQTAAAAATTEVQVTVGAQATLNARATGTSQAAATQTALATQNDATAIAGATLTAVGTVNAIATEEAQGTATAQAQGTLVAQSTQAVEPRPEPAPHVDCVKPTNPLWLADWMDYEVCRILTWFVWTPDNSQQVTNLQIGLNSYEPLGTLQELTDARQELQDQLYAYDWARTGLQPDDTLVVDIGVFFPRHVGTGLLAGNLDLRPNPLDPLAFVGICSLKVGDIFGQAISTGLCMAINWLVATGIMGWVQFLFDAAVWWAFVRYAWHLVTVTLPTML